MSLLCKLVERDVVRTDDIAWINNLEALGDGSMVEFESRLGNSFPRWCHFVLFSNGSLVS